MGRVHDILTSPSLPLVVCTFLRTSGTVGIMKTIGIYLEDINKSLGTTSTDLGIALGLLNAFCHLPAPFLAALYRHHSTRRLLLISGTCLPPIGVALTSMATSNAQMENYNLLFSLGLTGYGAGMVLLPLLAEFLRQAYGWRGGLLIISALMAHIIPVGMAIKLELDESSTQRNGFQSVPSSPKGEECNTSTSQDITDENRDDNGIFRRITNSLRQSDLYVDPIFILVYGVTLASHIVWSGWHSFLVPHALQRGISVRNTIIITFSAAIGNALSRVAVGSLTNSLVKPVDLFLFATILDIAALLCNVYFVNYYAMLVTTCISSVAIAGKAVLSQLIVRDRASSQKYDVAFAVDQFFIGFGMILGGYLSGKESPTT
ncbi:monocarboxylate transporter 6-like [Strongylocentrotus purpuratus]|uniref:Uncharacterized protein n=1 Tax=Strongylocentrotus purpuratus TaxID=7668 RepID=A0A7M7NPV8_STRPU|nr:monocarboxylate transporter 6-like [Strongylocentrotus purpuratus]